MMTDKDENQTSAQADPVDDGLDPAALAAIRDLLAAENTSDKAQEPMAAVMPAVPAKGTTTLTKREILESQSIAPQETEQTPAKTQKPAKAAKRVKAPRPSKGEAGMIVRARASVLGYRPTARHIAIASLALIVVFRPWLVLGIVFLSLFVLTGVFLILGYDGFWRKTIGLARWYARRHPSRAAEIHQKLDTFAMKWDSILDRFPEGSVDGLYLPDFGNLADADAQHDAALDRRYSDLRKSEV